jgi:integrase
MQRHPRTQEGTRIETNTAWHLRYWITAPDGTRQRVCKKLADKNDTYRTWEDLEPLIAAELASVNGAQSLPRPSTTLSDFVEQKYLPWVDENKAAATSYGYRRVWQQWKPHLGTVGLASLRTDQVTSVLTARANKGLGGRTLGHNKWFLSGVYEYAVSIGVVPSNPVPNARWNKKLARPAKQKEYSLAEVLDMLRVLEPVDVRAAAAIALAYFAALRPAEIRGLKWADYDGHELSVSRSNWRGYEGDTKTEGSTGTVRVIEPLRGLLEKLKAEHIAGEYILQNSSLKPLSLDSLNYRLITPTLKKAKIDWRGYYPCRRGISSLVTDTSKNALNSTGLLRHATPITALKHYTRAQKASIDAALAQVESLAEELAAKGRVR